MNPETRFSGHWICAQQGTGKTNLLLHMIASDLKKDAAIIIMDAKGDLTGPVRNLALGDRLVVLDPRQPFAINPLDVEKTDIRRAVNHLEYIFGALLEADVTPMQKALLRTILRAVIIAFPKPTLRTVQDIITNGPSAYKEHIQRLPPDLQGFFTNEWKDYDRTRGELKWRFRLLMENDLIRNMFSAPHTRFNIAVSMQRGDVVVVDNSQQYLHEDGSAFLGRFFLAQIWKAATARSSWPQHKKTPVYVYIDECHTIIRNDPIIATIIDMCRSQNIALILAHQRAKQIEDTNVLSALENCAIKMANVDAEAKYFSQLLHIPEEKMNQLPRGQFATHIRGEGTSIVEIPLAELPYYDMTQDEKHKLERRMQLRYGIESEKQNPPLEAASRPDTHKGPTKADQINLKPEPAKLATAPQGSEKPLISPQKESDLSKPGPWKRS
jgi:type IV secretory pathway VirB4 component